MRAWLAIAAVVAAGCGRIGFDPAGSGGGVEEENLVERPIIAAGRQFSCVRRGDGSVWCWGDGRRAQLGSGEELPRTTPARVPGLPAVVAVEAGGDHACAITDAGEVWCWGHNGLGQVDGSTGEDNKPPTRVPLPRSATAVSAGAYHSCAVLDDQSLSCWGKNSDGQIGKGPISGDHVLQHDVLDRVSAVAAGTYHTCAVRDGTVFCWGDNSAGQVGDGTTDGASAPTSIGIAATSVATGDYFSCALEAGRYRCWGDNGDGQLGIDRTSVHTPPAPSTLSGLIALRAGGSHACAMRDDDSLWCWGNNTLGAVGDGTGDGAASRTTTPIQIATPRADVAAGTDHTCDVDADGTVTCWGVDRFGAVGVPVHTAQLRPRLVQLPDFVEHIAAGSRFACAVLANASQDLYCWGQNGFGQLALPEGAAMAAPTNTGIASVEALSLGENHACATIAGTLECWGHNSHGQLGDGTTNTRYMPMPVALNLSGVASGYDFSCGLLTNNVYCWGADDRGKLGAGSGDQLTPISVGVTATNVDVGTDHACAIDGNAATCWGWNERAQLGRGTTSLSEAPGPVPGTWQTMTTGAEHTCGTDGASALLCWGMNAYGMLGTANGSDRTSPTQVVASGGREITARQYHTCAEIDGSARCWGHNENGEVGDGTATSQYAPSTVVDVPAGVTMFALGDNFSCVLASDGKVRCWGDNTFGQLGIGVLGFVPSPYTVEF